MPSVVESLTSTIPTTPLVPTVPDFYITGIWLGLFLVSVIIGLVITR